MTDSVDKTIRVIYIMGAGRSGSTLLATLLGSHSGVFSSGELCNLDRARSSGEYCSCGVPVERCELWSDIVDQWQVRASSTDISLYAGLQSRFERLRRWPRLLCERWFRRSDAFREYLSQTRALLEAICEATGTQVIVDSSKSAIRAALLSSVPGVDLRVLHLVRDVRAVAWSRKKSYERNHAKGLQRTIQATPVWRTSKQWLVNNLTAMSISRVGRLASELVRYEDIVTNTAETLHRVGNAASIDLSEVSYSAIRGEPIAVDHQIAGNRMRMSGAVMLGADWEWIERLPSRDQRVSWAIGGWLARFHGYRRELPRGNTALDANADEHHDNRLDGATWVRHKRLEHGSASKDRKRGAA